MAFRCSALLQIFRTSSIIRQNAMSSLSLPGKVAVKQYKTEEKITYLEDPDTFGSLSIHKTRTQNDIKDDEGDLKEEEFLQNKPMPSQKLTTRQYADIIKQYVESKRIKEAIDVLEVRMLKEDRVKPENYIYNILIGACAEVGYTKKAFKLYNDMKRRALKVTGDTYTCLFEACCNSPWPQDGLKNATHLRSLMIEKGIEPNLTNYNAMIKAFGRCGDVTTAFKIIDEMRSKKIKLRVHTFNHLLQACITDKNAGLRHALIVWRKMLKMREKPNIFSFNLMLKCVKDCNLGSKEDLVELIGVIQEHIALSSTPAKKIQSPLHKSFETNKENAQLLIASEKHNTITVNEDLPLKENLCKDKNDVVSESNIQKEITDVATTNNDKTLQFVEHSPSQLATKVEKRLVPNLLSKTLQIDQVLGLKEVSTVQDRFAIIGGQEDFLKEMESYSVPPDIKTFTQMLAVIDDTKKAELTLVEAMKSANVRADIDFYNMLIKKRALRYDYDGALEVKDMIAEENKVRKKKHPAKKKLQLKLNIISYGVLAMACKTKESAEKLLGDMEEEQIKVNIEILGTLLRQALTNFHFGYAMYVMNILTENNIKVNNRIIKHLETFNDRCAGIIEQTNKNKKCTDKFIFGYQRFEKMYKNWLREINIEEVLQTEHPWQQFNEPHPETVQRHPFEIKQPKKFYKRSRKFVAYKP